MFRNRCSRWSKVIKTNALFNETVSSPPLARQNFQKIHWSGRTPVRHMKFGLGKEIGYLGSRVVVDFEKHGRQLVKIGEAIFSLSH